MVRLLVDCYFCPLSDKHTRSAGRPSGEVSEGKMYVSKCPFVNISISVISRNISKGVYRLYALYRRRGVHGVGAELRAGRTLLV